MIKANTVSILFKIFGGILTVVFLILKGLNFIDIDMTQVGIGMTILAGLVIPIDISKIRNCRETTPEKEEDKDPLVVTGFEKTILDTDPKMTTKTKYSWDEEKI